METPTMIQTDSARQRKATAERLAAMSVKRKNNPFMDIEWPESLPDDTLWMPLELMTVHGTQAAAGLSHEELLRLSKWESIWFYSFNVHGERHLLRDVLDCMHTPGYEDVSEYLHHFVCEENNHSWFFSHFCTLYGGKVYVDKRIQFQSEPTVPVVNAFLIFSRILILEEMLDYYNVVMQDNPDVPQIVRDLNALHHLEEARHMAFGRAVVTNLFTTLTEKGSKKDIEYCRSYLERYISWCLDSLYYPQMYRDAGIADAYGFRKLVMADPARRVHHDAVTARVRKFLSKLGVL